MRWVLRYRLLHFYVFRPVPHTFDDNVEVVGVWGEADKDRWIANYLQSISQPTLLLNNYLQVVKSIGPTTTHNHSTSVLEMYQDSCPCSFQISESVCEWVSECLIESALPSPEICEFWRNETSSTFSLVWKLAEESRLYKNVRFKESCGCGFRCADRSSSMFTRESLGREWVVEGAFTVEAWCVELNGERMV